VIDHVTADRNTIGLFGNAIGGNVNVNINGNVATNSTHAEFSLPREPEVRT
jgi:hypothetical protein